MHVCVMRVCVCVVVRRSRCYGVCVRYVQVYMYAHPLFSHVCMHFCGCVLVIAYDSMHT